MAWPTGDRLDSSWPGSPWNPRPNRKSRGAFFLDLSAGEHETLPAAEAARAPTPNYGNFLQSIVDLLIVGFAVFLEARSGSRPRVGAGVFSRILRGAQGAAASDKGEVALDFLASFLAQRWYVIAAAILLLLIVVRMMKTLIKWALVLAVLAGLLLYGSRFKDQAMKLGTTVGAKVATQAKDQAMTFTVKIDEALSVLIEHAKKNGKM